MFNSVLKGIIENESVDVLEKTIIDKDNGSQGITWNVTKKILCNIQANSKYGEALITSDAGDTLTAVYNLYTRSKIQEGQRIKRSDGIVYEIRNVEHNGIKTILEHYKAYLTRVDNQ